MIIMDKQEKKEYMRKYREKNKEKHSQYYKKYREKNKEKIKQQQREYRKKNREKLKQYKREYDKNPRQRIDQILGTRCIICGSTEKLLCHEIHGKPHPTYKNYIINHSEDFVRMCKACHRFIHNISDKSMDFAKLIKLILLLNPKFQQIFIYHETDL